MVTDAEDPLAFLRQDGDEILSLAPRRRLRQVRPWMWAARAGFLTCHLAMLGVGLHWAGIMPIPAVTKLVEAVRAAMERTNPSLTSSATPRFANTSQCQP
jgi:hypothetical protein